VRILVVDNYDSFVFNLVQYLGQLGVEAEVWRNDDQRLAGAADIVTAAEEFGGVLLSPGPGTPERAGASIGLVHACAAAKTPLLGVCLGHQAIGVAFGATVDRAPELRHGKTSSVFHSDVGVLHGLPDPFTATRYHSLTILPQTLPPDLEVTARTTAPGERSDGKGEGERSGGKGEGERSDGKGEGERSDGTGEGERSDGTHSDGTDSVIMAVRHRELPIHGVQFHPESILTEGGHRMLANWLGYCGAAPPEELVGRLEREVADTVRVATTRNSA